MTIVEFVLLVGFLGALVCFLMLPRSRLNFFRLGLLFLLTLSFFTTFCSSLASRVFARRDFSFSPIPIEQCREIGNGWVASYVAKPPNARLAEVQVGDERHLCTVPEDVKIGQMLRVYEMSFRSSSGHGPFFFATHLPPVTKK